MGVLARESTHIFKMKYLIAIFAVFGMAYANHPDFKPYNDTSALLFHGSDLDGDGVFSRTELDQVFVKYDADNDGRVSRHEYTTYLMADAPTLEQFAHALYDDYDVIADHHLDHRDFDAYYAKLDANQDGQVTYDEFVPYWTDLFIKNEHLHGTHG